MSLRASKQTSPGCINTLKLGISLTALEVVHETPMICGMTGYKHNIDYSVGCHLRDLFQHR